MPNHYAGDLLHTMAMSELSRVRTELFGLLVIPSLAPHPVQANRLSDNVGGVKHFLSVLLRALRRARHFALAEQQPYPTKARSQSFQVRNSVRPIHLFGRIRDHDS